MDISQSLLDWGLGGFEGHEEFLIEGLFDSVVGSEVVDGLPPAVLLVGSEWELVGVLGGRFLLDVKVPVALGLLVVVVLVLFEFVELVDGLESVIVLAVDGHVVGDGFVLRDLLQLDSRADQQHAALFLGRGRSTLTCSL
jgi:hypothetical protein